MLKWLRRKSPSKVHPLRELLFGDTSPAQWAGAGSGEPWRGFAEVEKLLERREQAAAVSHLEMLVARPGMESRHYLQAWHSLRALGVLPPPGEAKHLYGVVIDMPVSGGTDTLAAYEDGRARYLNFSGKAVIWERPDSSLDGEIGEVLAAGRGLVTKIGPWEGPRPELPGAAARISLLTPSGLHFGQAEASAFVQDPLAQPVLRASTTLMQALIARASAA